MYMYITQLGLISDFVKIWYYNHKVMATIV